MSTPRRRFLGLLAASPLGLLFGFSKSAMSAEEARRRKIELLELLEEKVRRQRLQVALHNASMSSRTDAWESRMCDEVFHNKCPKKMPPSDEEEAMA